MTLQCPDCRAIIPDDKIHPSNDIAVCPTCRSLFAASELESRELEQKSAREFMDRLLASPPEGMWLERSNESIRIASTLHSWYSLVLGPVSAGAALFIFFGVLPGAAHGSKQQPGLLPMMVILGAIAVTLAARCVLALAGHVEVTLDGCSCSVFTGVGRFGRTRRIPREGTLRVNECRIRQGRSSRPGVEIVGRGRIAFGAFLSNDHRRLMIQALNAELQTGTPDP